jgi:hypothetical protein
MLPLTGSTYAFTTSSCFTPPHQDCRSIISTFPGWRLCLWRQRLLADDSAYPSGLTPRLSPYQGFVATFYFAGY